MTTHVAVGAYILSFQSRTVGVCGFVADEFLVHTVLWDT